MKPSSQPKLNSTLFAGRVADLAAEHGLPNHFHLHEIVGGDGPGAVLAASRVARLEMLLVNELLAAKGMRARYVHRGSDGSPAGVKVESLSSP